MSDKQQDCKNDLTRRKFVRDSAVAAAGLAVGLSAGSGKAADAGAKKTRSYNSEMKYRPLGKTGIWVSAV